jgi:hypothetical protein
LGTLRNKLKGASLNWVKNEIEIPKELDSNSNAQEVLRAWIVDGKLRLSINAHRWTDPANFGIVLADIALTCAESNSSVWNLAAHEGQQRIFDKIKEAMSKVEISESTGD